MVVDDGGEYAMGAALQGKLLIDSFSSSRSSCVELKNKSRDHKPNLLEFLNQLIIEHCNIIHMKRHVNFIYPLFSLGMYEMSN